MRSIKPTTIRLDDDDIRLVEIVKRKYGQSSLIGAIRCGLRVAAEAGNVATNVAEPAPPAQAPQHNAKKPRASR